MQFTTQNDAQDDKNLESQARAIHDSTDSIDYSFSIEKYVFLSQKRAPQEKQNKCKTQ